MQEELQFKKQRETFPLELSQYQCSDSLKFSRNRSIAQVIFYLSFLLAKEIISIIGQLIKWT